MSENKEKKKIILIGGAIFAIALGSYIYLQYNNSIIIVPNTDRLNFLE